MLIYSSHQKYAREEIDSLFYLGKSIGHKPIDIMNFNKKKISQSLKNIGKAIAVECFCIKNRQLGVSCGSAL